MNTQNINVSSGSGYQPSRGVSRMNKLQEQQEKKRHMRLVSSGMLSTNGANTRSLKSSNSTVGTTVNPFMTQQSTSKSTVTTDSTNIPLPSSTASNPASAQSLALNSRTYSTTTNNDSKVVSMASSISSTNTNSSHGSHGMGAVGGWMRRDTGGSSSGTGSSYDSSSGLMGGSGSGSGNGGTSVNSSVYQPPIRAQLAGGEPYYGSGQASLASSLGSNNSSQLQQASRLHRPSAAERALKSKGISSTFNPENEEEEAEKRKGTIAEDALDLQDLRTFVNRPAPVGKILECTVVRDRSSLAKKSFPVFQLHLETESKGLVFLMAGRKRKKSRTAHYLISMDKDDTARNSINFMGKVKSNFVGTEYNIWDKGDNIEKTIAAALKRGGGGSSSSIPSSVNEPSSNSSQPLPSTNLPPGTMINARQQLGAIMYKATGLGRIKGVPRQMTVLLPAIGGNGQRIRWSPSTEDDYIQSIWSKGGTESKEEVIELVNKAPEWSEEFETHILDFGGRVTKSSIKNFQLIHPDHPDFILCQFGKVAEDMFHLDFQYPFSPLQAFALALSAIDSKLACE